MKDTFTYLVFMNGENLVKIGRTKDLVSRIRQIKTANPMVTNIHYYDGNIENLLHRIFKDCRYIREWFDYSDFGYNNFMNIVESIVDIRLKSNSDCEAYSKIFKL